MLNFTKKMKGWRTVTFNAFVLIVAIASMPETIDILPLKYAPWVALFASLGNTFLRTVTDTKIGRGYNDD